MYDCLCLRHYSLELLMSFCLNVCADLAAFIEQITLCLVCVANFSPVRQSVTKQQFSLEEVHYRVNLHVALFNARRLLRHLKMVRG